MLRQSLHLIFMIHVYTICYGKDYYAVDSQKSSTNHTCQKQGQKFQPCNTLEDYSRIFSINIERNITVYLLDNRYVISENSYFYFTASLVKIGPWNNDSLVTINCKNHSISFDIRYIEILVIQSVHFLHCGKSGIPLIHKGQGYTYPQITSKMEITSCIFAKASSVIFSIYSIITNVKFKNVTFIRNAANTLFFHDSWPKSNLSISHCKFVNNTSNKSQTLIELNTLNNVSITNSQFIRNSPHSAMVMTDVNYIQISNSFFQENEAQSGSVLHANGSRLNISITGSIFNENIANGSGGALFINGSSLALHDTNFTKNTATINGGALAVCGISQANVTHCSFEQSNAISGDGGAVYIRDKRNYTIQINDTKFIHNRAEGGGAIKGYGPQGNFIFHRCHILNNHVDFDGGGLHVYALIIHVVSSLWINNTAEDEGGAIYFSGYYLKVTSSDFTNNEARSGGALRTAQNKIYLWHSNFTRNKAIAGDGGAILNTSPKRAILFPRHGSIVYISCWFVENVVLLGDGGALKVINGEIKGNQSFFINNFARRGGAVDVISPMIYLRSSNFTNNEAQLSGGAVRATNSSNMIVVACVYHFNSAHSGAGLDLTRVQTTLIYTCNFSENSVNISEIPKQKSGEVGGAIRMAATNLLMIRTILMNNDAIDGGAMNIDEASKVLVFYSNFSGNKGKSKGGAISISKQNTIYIHQSLFIENSAYIGGAINSELNSLKTCTLNYSNYKNDDLSHLLQNCISSQVRSSSTSIKCLLSLLPSVNLYNNTIIITNSNFSDNNSSKGGAISIHGHNNQMGVPDSSMKCTEAIISNCIYQENFAQQGGAIYFNSSSLFIENGTFLRNEANLEGGGIFTESSLTYLSGHLNFTDNRASGKGGAIFVEFIPRNCKENSCPITWEKKSTLHFKNNAATTGPILYGGMLDRCNRIPDNYLMTNLDYDYYAHSYGITSQGVRFCFCSACETREMNESLYPGQTLSLNLACVDQLEQPLNNCTVTSDYTPQVEGLLGPGEYRRQISGCQTLIFHAFSQQTGVVLLNIEGVISCSNPWWKVLTVHIKINTCPLGFQLYKRECGCDKRLNRTLINIMCDITNGTVLLSSNGWLSYKGHYLRIHPNCPLNYCSQEAKHIIPTEPDSQCAYHRGGVLCGGCMANYSVVLGSWKCINCSHLSTYNYIWLTVLLALAGVALVAFLLLLKMTVSSGTTNGLIFYANILSFSGLLDYRTCPINPFLRAFLSWINLDLGVEVCYYSGMDVYQKTWLQFVFPFYIWFLVAVIILFCHYSSRVMRLMGTRNIEVLATLFLLSYAKLLKTIVTAFSYTDIMIAQADNVSDPLVPTRVWVYDGSIEYLRNKHTPLFIISLLFLLFLFLPYTLLLSVGHYLYLMPNKKYLKIFHSTVVTTVMDAYHAPYSKRFRFWTGLCLLIRCFLFTIFAVSHSIKTNVFWTSASVIFLFSLRMIAKSRVYQKRIVDLLEIVTLVNLLMLMTAFYRDHFCRVLTASISLSALIFGFTVIIHIWQEIKKYKLFNKFNHTIGTVKEVQSTQVDQVPVSANDAKPSVSYVELRETLIET